MFLPSIYALQVGVLIHHLYNLQTHYMIGQRNISNSIDNHKIHMKISIILYIYRHLQVLN